jgi:hypothetical protein
MWHNALTTILEAVSCRKIFNKISGWWFQPTPLKKMSSSVGMMTCPTEWKHKIHDPNHQPDMYSKG